MLILFQIALVSQNTLSHRDSIERFYSYLQNKVSTLGLFFWAQYWSNPLIIEHRN